MILNSLAIEFIVDIDESFTSGAGYDTEFRYLKAGIIETVIRRYVNLHFLNKCFFPNAGCGERKSVILGGPEDRTLNFAPSQEIVSSVKSRVFDGEDERADDVVKEIVKEADLYCLEPKVYFYGVHTWLSQLEEKYRDRNAFLHALVKCFQKLTFTPIGSAVFSKWGKFVSSLYAFSDLIICY